MDGVKGLFGAIWFVIVLGVGLLSFAAAWAGMAWLIGPIIGTIVLAVIWLMDLNILLIPASFVGALNYWDWPWYAAVAVAVPGLVIAVPAVAASMLGSAASERMSKFQRRAIRRP